MALSLQDVINQMAEAGITGLCAGDLVADGKYHRFHPKEERKRTKKSAWYVLFEHVTRSGRQVWNGSYGMGPDTWTVQRSEAGFSTEDRAELAEARKVAQRAAAAERRREGQSAAEKAGRLWGLAREEGASPYLDRKQVRAYGVRFLRASLVVPVRDVAGVLRGCQFVDAEGGKRFNTGMVKEGGFHVLGSLERAERVLFAEGYATAASLHQATGWPVVAAFDAGNLLPVASALRPLYPDAEFIFCGDDDRHLRRRLRERLEKMGAPADVEPDGAWVIVFGSDDGLRVRAEWAEEKGVPWIRLQVKRLGFEREYALRNAGREAALACARKLGGVAVFPSFAAEESDGTDFNDLHVAAGLGIVRSQVVDGIAAARKAADVACTAGRTLPGRGGKGAPEVPGDEVEFLLSSLTMIYGATATVWDGSVRRVAKPETLDLVYGPAAAVWKRHPKRRVIGPDDLVFEPDPRKLRDGQVNMFDGLALEPDGSRPCGRIVGLLFALCGEDQGLFDWVVRWLALPLQQPGAKLHTSLIFHGRIEGTGKSLFFSVLRKIYGRYATVIGQHQLNGQYSGWMSQKLFVVAEEVLTQRERKEQKGYLKHLVSNDTLMIEEKFLPAREERNLTQAVFLSNEIQPLALDEFDRRYTVSYCDTLLPEADYQAVVAEIEAGGVAGFFQYLLDVDLGGFGVATKPYENAARRRLITLGMAPERKFWELWRGGALDVPFCSCLSGDLYQAFRAYCRLSGERFIPTQTAFGSYLRAEVVGKQGVTKEDRVRVNFIERDEGGKEQARHGQKTVYWVPHEPGGYEKARAMADRDVQEFTRGAWAMAAAAKRMVQ